jgi:hypothetical protein
VFKQLGEVSLDHGSTVRGGADIRDGV